MSEYINNRARRQETLKRLIRQLHEGKAVEEVKREFAALLSEVSATEIAEIEQALIGEGLPEMEIKRLCDVHVAIFRESLDAQARPETVPGHPIHTFRAENAGAAQVLDALQEALDALKTAPGAAQLQEARERLQRLREYEKHYIFPRSPAIIGRKVQKCHPPASVHRVQRILDDFRAGRRDEAGFWIHLGPPDAGGKFVHIRYFAVRDEQGEYQGTLEVTQDVTHIRALEGERRLLDDEG